MVQAIAFDTHRFVKSLTACGFTEKQAEVLAMEHVRLLEGNLATRTDITAVKADIANVRADIAKVEAGLQVEIQKVKADLLKWIVTAMTAQTAVTVGLVMGLIRFF